MVLLLRAIRELRCSKPCCESYRVLLFVSATVIRDPIMAKVALLYNQLPTLEDAGGQFHERDQIFAGAKSPLA